jgi:hypothetical protein
MIHIPLGEVHYALAIGVDSRLGGFIAGSTPAAAVDLVEGKGGGPEIFGSREDHGSPELSACKPYQWHIWVRG